MSVTPSEAIIARFNELFDVLDTDGDKVATWADYQRLVDRYVTGYVLDPTEPKAHAIETAYRSLWQELVRHSGAEDRLEREAFVTAMHAASEDRSRFNAAEAVAEAVFDLLDEDGDGRISLAEFLVYAAALGATEADARTRFAHVDIDGDGHISREEFVLSAREYLFGEDTKSPGGFVFGVV
ncbi:MULTISPECIES: EF-hand domain-containing protein [Nocardiopsis]|uniref:EF-hand domain-containing protein n=1 Tax=Nocardiopsis lambiniae TaxID=3075539 RepID=A0ABU2MG93_9ACTN|nr:MULTISPECIES: EF-hand domain-containing protein [unclassified Nocardiopsis]MDE3721083.1 EF-hand domain-containing protein [Nocardiopsis sp. N85]MDT0331584.1 EF-hand domain-containing protein [Nocardiopsis sp. DSM 44743]